jgi:thiol-disulfide isomerase/thioredoxin
MNPIKKMTLWHVVLSWLLALALEDTARPQAVSSPCEPSPQVKQALQRLTFDDDVRVGQKQRREQALAILRPLLRQFPDDPFVHRSYLSFVTEAMEDELDRVIADYKARLERHPDDPLSLYLHGISLIRRQSRQAATLLEKALERAPDFAPAHLALAQLYLPLKDKQKARARLESFMKLCPSSLEAYDLVSQIDDLKFLVESARRLRAALEKQADPEAISRYPILWRLEFQVRPPAEHAEARKQVEEDLKRLRALDLASNMIWLLTLRRGYEITNDTEGIRWAEDQMVRRFPHSSQAMYRFIERWRSENPRPGQNDSPEKTRTYYQALFRATEEWVRRWPDHPIPWLERLYAASQLDDVPTAELETISERLLSAYEKQSDRFYAVPPPAIQVAQLYIKRGIRIERIPELIERGVREIERRTQRYLRRDDLPDKFKEAVQSNLDYSYWQGWPILVEAYLKMNRREKAREVLFEMENYLAKQKPEESNKDRAMRQATYFESLGRLAEAENRKLDALAFYQNALLYRPGPDEKGAKESKDDLMQRAERLWKDLGGTVEGWQQAWLARRGAAPAAEPATSWEKRGTPLPDFELQDLRGRKWRLADLKGKVAFINIWATWCSPCREELPHLQKLHDRLKDRPDVLVLTLNVDTDVGLVEPYVKKNGFSFPVILAYAYVENFLGLISIPRNWVIGPDGTLLIEQVGFGGEGEKWFKEALEAIERARRSG